MSRRALAPLFCALFLVSVAAPGHADLFHGAMIGDPANNLAGLGERLSEATDTDGTTVAEFRSDDGRHVMVGYSDRDGIVLLHAIGDDGMGAVRLGQTTATELAEAIGQPDLRFESAMAMVPVDGQWTWRVLMSLDAESSGLLQLVFAADDFDADEPSTIVPSGARVASLTLVGDEQATQLLQMTPEHSSNTASLGRAILELATQ